MADQKEPIDPSEPDLYWSGHSGFAMLPGVVLGALLSAVFMLGALPLAEWLNLPEDWTVFVRFWLILLGWIAAGLVWTYRAASFVYRLTPSRLHVDFGMLYRPVPPIVLSEVTDITCRAWILRRLFQVGSIIIQSEGRPAVRLRGIFRPEQFAAAIQSAVNKARTA